MNEPKRHHWWPQLQSRHWTNESSSIYASTRDGNYFSVNPSNIGVESELYTRFNNTGDKDRQIEKWFATSIEYPFSPVLDEIVTMKPDRERFFPDPGKMSVAKQLGALVSSYREFITLSDHQIKVVSDYVASLLVRNPIYLQKIKEAHKQNGPQCETDLLKNKTLESMLVWFEKYRAVVSKSQFIIIAPAADHEFLFSDAGIVADEPWRDGIVPFDIHVPLTPQIALQVLPAPVVVNANHVYIVRVTNSGVARQNRIALGSAQRFIFSRKIPPTTFIKKYFGVPAPRAYGYRFEKGRIETTYDPRRDR